MPSKRIKDLDRKIEESKSNVNRIISQGKSSSPRKSNSLGSQESQLNNLEKRLQSQGIKTDDRNFLERALNLNEDQGLLGDIFEIADRPGQAVRSGLSSFSKGDNVLEGTIKGLTGENKVSGWDLVDDIIPNKDKNDSLGEKIARGAGGLAAEIFLDPLNYIGVGFADDLLSKGGKTLKVGGKAFKETNLMKNFSNAGDVAEKLGAKVLDISDVSKDVLKTAKDFDYLVDGNKLYKTVDKFGDIYKVSTGMNSGLDPAIFGLEYGSSKAFNKASSALQKTNPQLYDDLSDLAKSGNKFAKDILSKFKAPLKEFSKYADTSQMRKAKGETSHWKEAIIKRSNECNDSLVKFVKESDLLKNDNVKDFINSFSRYYSSKDVDFNNLDEVYSTLSKMITNLSGKTSVDEPIENIVKLAMDNGVVILGNTVKDDAFLNKIDDVAHYLNELTGKDMFKSGRDLGNSAGMIVFDKSKENIDSLKEILNQGKKGKTIVKDIQAKDLKELLSGLEDTSNIKYNNPTIFDFAKEFNIANAGEDINVNKFIDNIKGFSKNFNDLFETVRAVSKEFNFDYNKISNYVPLEFTENFLKSYNEGQVGGIEAFQRALNNGELPKTGLVSRIRSPKQYLSSRGLHEDPVSLNMVLKDIYQNNVDTYITEPFRLTAESGNKFLDLTNELVTSGTSLKTLDNALQDGFENGLLISTSRNQFKMSFKDMADDIKKQGNSNDIADFILKGDYLLKGDLNPDDLLDKEKFTSKLYSDVVSINKKLTAEDPNVKIPDNIENILKERKDISHKYKRNVTLAQNKVNKIKDFDNLTKADKKLIKDLKKKERELVRAKNKLSWDLNSTNVKHWIIGNKYPNMSNYDIVGSISDVLKKSTNINENILNNLDNPKANGYTLLNELIKKSDEFLSGTEDLSQKKLKVLNQFGINVPLEGKKVTFDYALNHKLNNESVYDATIRLNRELGDKFSKSDVEAIDRAFNYLSSNTIEKYVKDNMLDAGMTRFENGRDFIKKAGLLGIFEDDPNWSKYLEDFKLRIGDQPIYVNNSVVDLISRGTKKSSSPMEKMLSTFDKWLAKWKGAKLFSVGYPVRNVYGDTFNLYLGGMPMEDVLKGIPESAEDLRKMKQLREVADKNVLNGLNRYTGLKDKEVALLNEYDRFIDTGLLAQARTKVEVSMPKIEEELAEKAKNTNKIKISSQWLRDLTEKVRDGSEFADEMNRLNAFRWATNHPNKLKKLGYKDAVSFVSDVLFDYSDVSHFENSVMKRLFPFYSFARKNTEFQLQNILKNTSRYNNIVRFTKAFYEAQDIDESDLPEYATDKMYLPFEVGDKTNFIKVSPSFAELGIDDLVGGLNPAIKTPLEYATGLDFFKKDKKTTGAKELISEDLIGDILPIYQAFNPLAKQASNDLLDILGEGKMSDLQFKNYIDAVAKGTLVSVIGQVKDKETNHYFRNRKELDRLNELRKEYKKRKGKDLPTLDELGLDKKKKKRK